MMMNISVVICSFNPKPDYFNQVLDSLRIQTIPNTEWELLIIDNGSTAPIEGQFNTSWHPHVRYVIETELGVSIARARGIREAKGELLVMVDDDGPLFPNYIEEAIRIAKKYPQIGCFGGNQLSITNIKAPKHYEPYLEMIGYRKVNNARISNMYRWDTTPAGAGMVVRASIAALYADAVFNRKQHAALGRRGNSLMSSQDIDLAYNAIDQGYLNGVFPELKIYHLSIEAHLNDEYLIKRRYHNVYSSLMLNYIRFGHKPKRIPRTTYWFRQLRCLLKGKQFEYTMQKMAYQATQKLQNEIKLGKIVR
jgi:glycosyltransferase involved in cell wall biosynthesis